MTKVSTVLAAVPYSWDNDGKEYAIKVTQAESKADKYRLGHLFEIADKTGMENKAVFSFLEGCKAGFEGIYTENTAKSRMTEIRRFFRVFGIKADSLTEAWKQGMGYHAMMNLCNDLAQENGLQGKGGAPKKAHKETINPIHAKDDTFRAGPGGNAGPQRISGAATYTMDQVANCIDNLSEEQVMYAASRLAARAAQFDTTKDFGSDLHTVIVAYDELEADAGEWVEHEEDTTGEIRSLLQQVAA